MTKVACIDLFCGAGGLTHGLISEGIPVVAGIDVDEACRYPFEVNNGAQFINQDVSQTSCDEIEALFDDADIRILAGCAPCQPFSTYSHRYDVVGSARWGLLHEFARLVKGLRPELVTMENVPTISKHAVFDDFLRILEEHGYHVHHGVVDCTLYGLPQKRRRMVLLASLLGPIGFIPPTHDCPTTVRDVISRFPCIVHGTTHEHDPMHAVSRLSDLNLERMRASRPGGTWRDWPTDLIAECHKRDSGRTYPGVYGRMTWDDPSPTLTTQFYGFGNGRFGHPEQDRAISLREGAILQGFPASYSFVPKGEPVRFKALGRMIGNAVPVTLGRAIGRSIANHLESVPRKMGDGVDVDRHSLVA